MTPCFFNGCPNPPSTPHSTKCLFHYHRGICLVDDCRNQVYARSLCVRHGGKRQCQFQGCTLNRRVGAFCTKHGPTDAVRRCSHDGCSSQAHLRGKCFRHGGCRFCKVDGCVTYARNRGYCARHTPKNDKIHSDRLVQFEQVEPATPPDVMSCSDLFWIQRALLQIEPPILDNATTLGSSDLHWQETQSWHDVMTFLLADVC
ncbi:hypothetical protein H257_16437 [Aphanomyces astaci]|uniref:Uncharacterized protein n=1 Tax=Aphanomyces astaci TaxID=112090 RepID=W4FKV2_APHAT|nr:hypothetical protein H257_16437 [Aphanomyces astaci]ETV67353.1 hypothetical protein H257_16437 [Aphanomyces astaci]|eukprot:XP_009843168.1 hypothetical protein H257_16437 [Aphanomyces astaci]